MYIVSYKEKNRLPIAFDDVMTDRIWRQISSQITLQTPVQCLSYRSQLVLGRHSAILWRKKPPICCVYRFECIARGHLVLIDPESGHQKTHFSLPKLAPKLAKLGLPAGQHLATLDSVTLCRFQSTIMHFFASNLFIIFSMVDIAMYG